MTQILVEGTIAPWLWNGSNYYQGPLFDIGLFAPAGTSLTGMPIQILWNDVPYVTAAITINGATVTLGPATGFYAPYAYISQTYQNITVGTFSPFNDLAGNIAVNSYDPTYAAANNPHGIGGALELLGPSASCNVGSFSPFDPSSTSGCDWAFDGYFYVTSMGPPPSVPGPVVGDGFAALAAALLIIVVCSVRMKGNHHVATQGVQDSC